MSTLRSTRLRKKLHLDEFKVFGFGVQYEMKHEQGDSGLLFEMCCSIAHPLSLGFVYESTGAIYLSKTSSGSVSEEERRAVEDWFKGRPDVLSVEVAPLSDGLYPPRAIQAFARPRSRQRILLTIKPSIPTRSGIRGG